MAQEFETLLGTVHGLVASVSAIAATLPDAASADAAEALQAMTADIPASVGPTATQAMQSVVAQVIDALQTPLRQDA
ncbi:hypothetical protein [Bordetella genomosp. 4]|uniref:Uncharacterized protein n=1 Tax=Bordetella genomosp. 4 TaxID=463044 RepID=A0A261U3Z3_9BORD|nr:hypothetical protein [Bordetella genomosp. 4]OZI48688.1 hypothetical protein CAL21_12685 [Bordetella genomosp. 4]OZI56688.1 hypothetical protein CAL20_14895 [Bordetella genomosp. 4]